jgi:hypothetical protein
VNAEFNWWLLIVGLGAGAAIAWLILADLGRREEDLSDRELAEEADLIAAELARQGRPTPVDTVATVLDLHREHLRHPPIDVSEDAVADAPSAAEEVAPAQSSPTRTGSAATSPSAEASETPKRESGGTSRTRSDQPAQ